MGKLEFSMEENRKQIEDVEKILQPLANEKSVGYVGKRAALAIIRAYHMVYFIVPIEQLTDEDLLSIHGIGVKSLKKVREIIKRKMNS